MPLDVIVVGSTSLKDEVEFKLIHIHIALLIFNIGTIDHMYRGYLHLSLRPSLEGEESFGPRLLHFSMPLPVLTGRPLESMYLLFLAGARVTAVGRK